MVNNSADRFGVSNNPTMVDDIFLDTLNMYLVLDTDSLADYVVPTGTTKARMLELSEGIYADSEKVNGKYAVNLFSDISDDITEVNIKNTDTFSLTNTTLNEDWDWFWGTLFGEPQYNTEFEDITAIHAVQPLDVTGGMNEVCERLKIGKSEYQNFVDFYNAHKDNYTVYLFRYQQSNYEALPGDIYKHNDNKTTWYKQDTQCYIFQETVNLDFDIIDVSFTDDQLKTTVIAVISDPIDVIPEPTPPIGMEDEVPWLTIVLLLAISIGGLAVTRIVKHYAKKTK